MADYVADLEAKNKRLKEQLQETIDALRPFQHVADTFLGRKNDEQLWIAYPRPRIGDFRRAAELVHRNDFPETTEEVESHLKEGTNINERRE